MLELYGSNYRVGGMNFFLDEREKLQKRLISEGMHEWAETAWVNIIVRRGWKCLDIGANMGYYTLLLSRLVGDQGKVIAFEPIPVSFRRMVRNVELNGFEGIVTPVMAAASDHNGSASHRFAIIPKDGSLPNYGAFGLGGTALKGDSDNVDRVDINLIRIDDYCNKNDIGRINFVKIDVEGHELQVIKGSENLLRTYKPFIMFEFTVDRRRSAEGSQEKLNILRNFGYTICSIEKNPWPHIREIKDIDFSKDQHFNAFCYHGAHAGVHF